MIQINSPTKLRLTRVVLEQQGHEVFAAEDAAAGIAIACAHLPQLALLAGRAG